MKDEQPFQLQPEEQSQPNGFVADNQLPQAASVPFGQNEPIIEPVAESEIEPSTGEVAFSGGSAVSPQPEFASEGATDNTVIGVADVPVDSNVAVQDLAFNQNDHPVTQPDPQVAASVTQPDPQVAASVTQPDPQVAASVTQPDPQVAASVTPPLVPTPPPASTSPTPSVKSSKRKKFIVIGLLVGVLALIGGGSVAAYNLWYQNPDKVLSDALMNTIEAKTATYTGSFDIDLKKAEGLSASDSDEISINVKIDGKNSNSAGAANLTLTAPYKGKDYKVSGSGVIDKDANLFIKVDDLKKTLQSAPSDTGLEYDILPSYFTAIVDKVDSKWIRISSGDTKEFSNGYAKMQTCMKDVLEKTRNDEALTGELIDVYSKNKFIVIDEELPAQDGSLGYVISVDEDKAVDFAKAADETSFSKELQKCDDSFKLSSDLKSSSTASDTKTKLELWVDRWSHQLTKVSLTSEDDELKNTFVIEPEFNQPVTVEIPKSYISLKELSDAVESAYTQYMMSTMSATTELNEVSLRDTATNSYNSNNLGKEPSEAEIRQLLQSSGSNNGRTL
jgi:hypothetical protein